MSRKILAAVIAAVALIIAGGFLIREASALTIIPPSFEFNVTPGQPVDLEVKLFNETQNPLELYSEVTPFGADGETGEPAYNFNEPLSGLSSWVSVEKGPLTLAAGERKTIPVKINVPADAEPGGQYAVLFFSTQPPKTDGTQGVAVGTKLGTLLLARVAGNVVEQGSIKEFSLGGGATILNRLPVNFVTRFQNTGNVHLRPAGTISVTNLFGQISGAVDVNPTKGATLPNSVRRYESTWGDGTVATGATNAWSGFWQEFGNEWNNFGFGPYAANLSVSYGTAHQPATAALNLWIIPWRVLSIFAAIIVGLIFLLRFVIKRYNAWIIKKAQAKSGATTPESEEKPKKKII